MLENEYIERNAVLKHLSEEQEFYAQNKETDDAIDLAIAAGIDRAIESIKNGLSDIPNADVAPVAHGKWDDSFDGITPYCTACKMTHNCLTRTPDYCPHCGAKMDLREGKQ